MGGRRGQRGYGRSQHFGHSPGKVSLNPFNPNQIEFGPPRLQYLNKKGKKIVLREGDTSFHSQTTKPLCLTTHAHPKYQKYQTLSPHTFTSYQRVCTPHRVRQGTPKSQSPLLHRTSQRWGIVTSYGQAKKKPIA